jgi:PAS domain S-box-containing protein
MWAGGWKMLAFCLFVLAYSLAYRYSKAFDESTAAPFWFPDSVLLCTLLVARPRWWWLFLLATLPIRVLLEIPLQVPYWFLASTFAIDCAKAACAALLLRRCLSDPLLLTSVRALATYCLIAVLAVPGASAFAGAAARHAIGHDYWASWQQWFLGDAMASFIINPLIFSWLLRPVSWRGFSRAGWLEAALVTGGLLVTVITAFSSEPTGLGFADSRYWAPVPVLFWATIRFGILGATGGVALLTIFAVAAALSGYGPFEGSTPEQAAAHLQWFLLLRAAPLYLFAVLIEQTRGAERSLRESEHRFRVMADTVPVLIWMSGTDKGCEYVNAGWLSFTGRSIEAERGSGRAAGVHPEDYDRCLAIYESSFDARQPFEMDYRLHRWDGQYRWILGKGVPRYATNGEFLGYIGSAIDITERREHEQALRESEERYREVDRKLTHSARLAALGELTALVAHEISQPLTAILSNAEAAETLLMSTLPTAEEVRRILADICKDTVRADTAIRRMRALVQKREVQVQPVDVNHLVTEVLSLAKGDVLRRGVRLRMFLAPDLPPVSSDPSQLQQILLNLIVNAMDAMSSTPEPERALTLRTNLIGSDRVEVTVLDRGQGISPGNLPRLFDSFFTTKAAGMGLGLSLSRSIIEAHQGRIWAENRPEGGAAFHFTLPCAGTHEAGNRDAELGAQPETSQPAIPPQQGFLLRLP